MVVEGTYVLTLPERVKSPNELPGPAELHTAISSPGKAFKAGIVADVLLMDDMLIVASDDEL